jgi:O-antigen/teichoic acid export membrane protein
LDTAKNPQVRNRLKYLVARFVPRSEYRRHALVTSLTSVGLYAAGLATGPILARALGPSGRGDIAAVLAPATVLVLALAFGLPTAAAYFVDTIPEKELLVTATAFGIVVGTPICIALWFLAPGYLEGHSPASLTWARIVLLTVPLSVGMSTALEIRRRIRPGLSWNLWRSSPLLVPAIAIIVLGLAGRLSLQSVLAANFVGSVIPMLLLASRLIRRHPWPLPSLNTLRRILPYAWRTASLGTAMSLTNRLDQVLLVGLVTPAELGLYAVSVMVASVTNPLTSGLSSALFGHLRGETSEVRAHARFRKSLATTMLVSGAVALGLALMAPLLLRIAFGNLFAPATTTLRLLLPGAVAFDILGVIVTKLFSEGRPGEASWAALLGAVLTVIGLVTLAPRYGIEGAAVVTSIAWISQVAFLVQRGALRSRPGLTAGTEAATEESPPTPAFDA